MAGGLPPWHMWGNSQTMTVDLQLLDPHTAAAPPNPPQNQLVRIAYARPENWRFLLWARTVGFQAATIDDLNAARLVVWWNVIVGVGRSQVNLTRFQQFSFTAQKFGALPGDPFVPKLKFANSGIVPLPDDDIDPLGADHDSIDQLVAQDIQVQFQVLLGQTFPPPFTPTNMTVEVGALFSPEVHVRPEWFARIGQFPGGETLGK